MQKLYLNAFSFSDISIDIFIQIFAVDFVDFSEFKKN